jgi:TatA/E family protein of Tat protein translocase
MFGIGMPEMILILAIALIVIGPKKLPDLAKSLGRAMNEFKKATREIKESIDIDGDLKDVRQSFDDINKDVKGAVDINPLKSGQTTPSSPEDKAAEKPPTAPPGESPRANAAEGTSRDE